MAEYIDRVEYCEKHCRCSNEYCDRRSCPIWKAPAADVAPVVRCKDCKWFADNKDGEWFDCWLFQTIQIIPEDAPKPDDFCSRGERIEEVRNGQV